MLERVAYAGNNRAAGTLVLLVTYDRGVVHGWTLQGIVGRGVVDDQNAVYRTSLLQQRLDCSVDDIGIVEGVDMS